MGWESEAGTPDELGFDGDVVTIASRRLHLVRADVDFPVDGDGVGGWSATTTVVSLSDDDPTNGVLAPQEGQFDSLVSTVRVRLEGEVPQSLVIEQQPGVESAALWSGADDLWVPIPEPPQVLSVPPSVIDDGTLIVTHRVSERVVFGRPLGETVVRVRGAGPDDIATSVAIADPATGEFLVGDPADADPAADTVADADPVDVVADAEEAE